MSWKVIGLGIGGRHRPLRIELLLLGLALLSSCRTSGRSERVAHPPRAEVELDIMETVFRYQFEHNGSVLTSRNGVECFYLEVDRKNPPPELLARFAGHVPPVERVSARETRVPVGVPDTGIHVRGIILMIKGVRWIDDDHVEVEGGYFEGSRSSSGNTYRVERRQGVWVVVNDTLHWVS